MVRNIEIKRKISIISLPPKSYQDILVISPLEQAREPKTYINKKEKRKECYLKKNKNKNSKT